MKRVDIAYIAGIFDGEGCIEIRKDRIRPYNYALRCSVEMVNEYIPQLLKFQFGGNAHRRTRKYKEKDYTSYRWDTKQHQASSFLEVVLPYLRLKHPQAELGIEFMKGFYPRGAKLTDEELALREADFILMRRMKHNDKI